MSLPHLFLCRSGRLLSAAVGLEKPAPFPLERRCECPAVRAVASSTSVGAAWEGANNVLNHHSTHSVHNQAHPLCSRDVLSQHNSSLGGVIWGQACSPGIFPCRVLCGQCPGADGWGTVPWFLPCSIHDCRHSCRYSGWKRPVWVPLVESQ